MIVRLTYVYFLPERLEDARKIFNQEIAPVVKAQKGNESVLFLQPTDGADEYISLTTWQSEDDAQAYEASGVYKQLIEKAAATYSRPPILKTYNVR